MDKMRKNTKLWLVLFMIVGMVLGTVSAASAQKNPFPTTKQPSSGRFDISGFFKITASGGDLEQAIDINATISGGGSFSGQNMQMDMTMNIEAPQFGDEADPAPPSSITISMVLLDGRLYLKIPSLTGEEDQWVVTDAGTTDTSSLLGGMSGGVGGLTGLDPSYADAFTVTEEGKETLNGAPTTRYRVDIDYEKLLAAMGSTRGIALPTDTMSETTYVMHIWVGDNDQYLHKMHMLLDSSATISDSTLRSVFELTMAFRDFDQPITITAPPNAQELDLASQGISPSIISGGGVLGMPGAVATGVGMGMPSIGTGMAGMPRTGAPHAGFPLEAMLVVAFGLLCLVMGGLARRASIRT
jgi:ribosomal protein S9